MLTSTSVTSGLGSQLSVAVTVAAAGTASLHSMVISAGQVAASMTGAVVSSTVITCTHGVPLLPQVSVGVHVLVIVYWKSSHVLAIPSAF